MFNQSEKKLEQLKGSNVKFVSYDRDIIITPTNLTILERINEFVDAFLQGFSSCAGNADTLEYFVHGMIIEIYQNDIMQNDRFKLYSPVLQKFELPIQDKFFTNCNKGMLKLFITFEENAKEGVAICFRFNI